MTHSSFQVKVPGKLLIAGEYAVLEPKQQAIVAAINRYVTAYIEPNKKNQLNLPQLGIEQITWETNNEGVKFSIEDSRLNFIRNSILVVEQFLREKSITPCPFNLTIKSELDDPLTGRKYGLGSSASVVTAAVSAMLIMHGDENYPPSLEQIYKLSAIAHLQTQKSGSGADIAAATFGGWLVYSAFNRNWLANKLAQGMKLTELMDIKWPDLSITSIKPPKRLNLCVGWTGEPVSTAVMIKKIQILKEHSPEIYRRFLKESSKAVSRIITSFRLGDCIGAIKGLSENRRSLKILGELAECSVETVMLTQLCSIAEKYGSGKSSGAGGGDCGIAFIQDADQIEELYDAWNKYHIYPLQLDVSQLGVSMTEYNCEPSLEEFLRQR